MIIKKHIIQSFRKCRLAVNMLCSLAKFGELKSIRPTQILLICHDINRGYTYRSRKYSQLIDSINQRLEEQGIKTITLATPFSVIPKSAAYGDVLVVNGMLLRAIVADKFKRLIYKRANINDGRVKAWGRILDQIQPVMVIGIQPTPEICIVAKNKKIHVADLQHGLVYDIDGYYGKGHRQKYDQEGWPDSILCWDQPSADYLRTTAPATVDLRVIGNPWFLRFIHPRDSDALVRSVMSRRQEHNDKPIVLVTLQWGMERYCDAHPSGIPRPLFEFMQRGGGNYTWWLRLHPVQMQEPAQTQLFKLLEQEFGQHHNIFWRHCSKEPLPIILKQVSLHLTSHSAVTVEAAWFNVTSGLLDERRDLLKEWFAREIAEGFAEIVRPDSDSIKRWLHARLSERACQPRQSIYMSSEKIDMFISEIKNRIKAREPR